MQTYYDFTDFLTTLPAETVLLLAIISLLLFTLGLLLGWLLQRRSTRAYRKQLMIAKREREEYQQRLSAADEEQKSLARELEQLTNEKDKLLTQLGDAGTTNESLSTKIAGQRAENEQLTATNQSFATTIEDLNDQVIGLKTRNAQLLGGNTGGNAGAADPGIEQRLRSLEEALSALQPASVIPTVEPPSSLNLGRSTHEVKIGEPLPASEYGELTPDETRDDLTRIKSVGPFNQEKLYAAGVSSFSQIAAWNDNDIEEAAARIGYVAELIRKENWVGQAQKLAAADGTPEQALTQLPSIDEDLADVLREAGIRDLTELADTPPLEIEAIIFQSGRQPVAGAEDWPEDAARWLADHGDIPPVG